MRQRDEEDHGDDRGHQYDPGSPADLPVQGAPKPPENVFDPEQVYRQPATKTPAGSCAAVTITE